MYEENTQPLPEGDAIAVFGKELASLAMFARPLEALTPESVLQLANKPMQEPFAAVCRRLLLPGSRIEGWVNLERLSDLARSGNACLICMTHASNLDVPNLYTLAADQHDPDLFNRIIWIAGRKLSEDSELTQILIQSCNRLVLTPPSWFNEEHTEHEIHEAHQVNHAAQREMRRLRTEGFIFGLFPTGTRSRMEDNASQSVIPELDTYLRLFDYLVIGTIEGCTLPVSRKDDYLHESPQLDRVVYSFGPVHLTDDWRAQAQSERPSLDQRDATAKAMQLALSATPTA